MAKKDPADWWKDGVDPQDLSNFDSDVGSPWESPPLVIFQGQLQMYQVCDFPATMDPTNCIKTIGVKNNIPQFDKGRDLLKKVMGKATYLGTIAECPWLPEGLRSEGFVEPSCQKCVFIGKAKKDPELYVFVLLVTYKSQDELGYGDEPEYA